jgi:hypothetical protein
VEEHLVTSQISPRKERMIGILRGGFARFCEPSDLRKKQGDYGESVEGFKAQEG